MTKTVRRPTPIADQVDGISTWYTQQTKLGTDRYARARILSILLYLERTGLSLSDCRMLVVTDPMWKDRGNRTDVERAAELVGRTQTAGARPQYWFIVPKAAVAEVAA